MPTVQDDIIDALCTKLSKSASIDEATVEAVRRLLRSTKKLKADDVVALLSKDRTGATT